MNWNTNDNANGITNANIFADTVLTVFAQQQASVHIDNVAIHAVSLRYMQLEEAFLLLANDATTEGINFTNGLSWWFVSISANMAQ